MNQKILHYVWIGKVKNPMTKAALLNWKKHLPKDWKIKEWNETNIPMEIPFVKHWYEQKNYAFVSDYIRMYVIEKYGGIYMDTDMFFQQPIPQKWLDEDFCLVRSTIYRYGISLLIAKKNNKILKILLEIFNLPLFTYKNNYNKLLHSLLITEVLKELYGKKNKQENTHLGKFYIIGHNKVNLDMDDGQNIIKHFYGESWFPNSWDPNMKIDDIKEGRYYFVEKKLYQNNSWMIFKYNIFAYFITQNYKKQLRNHSDLLKLVNKLKKAIKE